MPGGTSSTALVVIVSPPSLAGTRTDGTNYGRAASCRLTESSQFSAAGLNAFEEDDDMLTAMARELVTQQGIGESADAVWRDMQVQQGSILPTKLVVPAASGTDVGSSPPPPEPAALPMPSRADAPRFGVRPPTAPSRRQGEVVLVPEQFSLF
jgi:hypothetical protein